MKRRLFHLIILLIAATIDAGAQTAREVLDKTASTLDISSGVTAQFAISSSPVGTTSGTLDVKGNKFKITTPEAIVYFDGTTQWAYMKGNGEVNVSTPDQATVQAINPIHFVNMYKEGYTGSLTTSGDSYEVHLTADSESQSIKEMYITVAKSTYKLSNVKMLRKDKWVDVKISGCKSAAFADSHFQFNAADYPEAEIIDLR